jgi:O-antigen ligase
MLALPVAAIILVAAGPDSLRTRITSMARPQGTLDSNQHRIVSWSTGVQMIKAHPVFGVGLEQVRGQFKSYVPARFTGPLPEGFYGHLHNFYLQYAAERGIPAAAFMVVFLVWPAVHWFRLSRRLAASRPSAAHPPHAALWALNLGAAAIIGIMVTGLFEHNLGDSEVLSLALAIMGGVGAVEREIADSALT